MKKIDSHLVSVVHLKEFTNVKNYFYGYAIKSRYKNIKRWYPRGVAYKKNYFRFRSKDSLDILKIKDPDYLENTVFKELEDQYSIIINKIKRRERILNKEAKAFLEYLFNIKMRNQSYRANFTGEGMMTNFKKRVDEVEDWWSEFEKRGLVQMSFEGFKKHAENYFSNPDVQADFYLRSFARDKQRQEGVLFQIKEFVMGCRWFILEAEIDKAFFTSDNPGFCIDVSGKEKLYNLRFQGDFLFIFPLTTHLCFFVSNKFKENADIIFKSIQYKPASNDLVNKINYGTVVNCNKTIYSHRKELFESVKFLENDVKETTFSF